MKRTRQATFEELGFTSIVRPPPRLRQVRLDSGSTDDLRHDLSKCRMTRQTVVAPDGTTTTTTTIEFGRDDNVVQLLRDTGLSPHPQVMPRESWTVREKAQIASHSLVHGKTTACARYNVSMTNVVRWQKELPELRRAIQRGQGDLSKIAPPRRYGAVFELLFQTVVELRESLAPVRPSFLTRFLELRDPKFKGLSDKGKAKRVAAFKKFYGLTTRRISSKVAHLVPGDYEERTRQYYDILALSLTEIKPDFLIVADETFALFEPTGKVSIDPRGAQQTVVACYDDKGGATVMLSSRVRIDGACKPVKFEHGIPTLIFPKVNSGGAAIRELRRRCDDHNAHHFVRVAGTDSGWMNNAVFMEWAKDSIKDCRRILPNAKGIFIVDLHASHRGADFLELLKDVGWGVCYIPGGCTSLLQFHDVYLNKSYKDFIQGEYGEQVKTDIDKAKSDAAKGLPHDRKIRIDERRFRVCKWTADFLASSQETDGEKLLQHFDKLVLNPARAARDIVADLEQVKFDYEVNCTGEEVPPQDVFALGVRIVAEQEKSDICDVEEQIVSSESDDEDVVIDDSPVLPTPTTHAVPNVHNTSAATPAPYIFTSSSTRIAPVVVHPDPEPRRTSRPEPRPAHPYRRPLAEN